jgi:hypothetical protein
MIFCGHGGFCARVPNHAGAHTADYNPTTRAWDKRREVSFNERVERAIVSVKAVGDAVTLALLDLPTPYWADLNDD